MHAENAENINNMQKMHKTSKTLKIMLVGNPIRSQKCQERRIQTVAHHSVIFLSGQLERAENRGDLQIFWKLFFLGQVCPKNRFDVCGLFPNS